MKGFFKFIQRNAFYIVVTVLILGLLLQLVQSFSLGATTTQSAVEQGNIIIIDAGHGGFDPGAVAKDGTLEKELNLAIAIKLADVFRANGYTVILTRSADVGTNDEGLKTISEKKTSDIHNRVDLMNSYPNAVVISIHQNTYSDRTQSGTQIFYGLENDYSELFAEAVRKMVTMHLQLENRREIKPGNNNIYLLVHTTNPTIMVECGFMTNTNELAKLKDPVYQTQIAFCVYLGYLEYVKE